MNAFEVVGKGLWQAFLMAYEVWWALVIGFAISAIVQAWVPRERIQRSLSGDGARPIGIATVLGAASSSCSYAAIAIAKSLFQKGASAASALAFQFASTNLVWELGLVLWILMGWQFTLAEYIGGLLLIGLMWGLLRLFVSKQLEEQARAHAQDAQTGHQHHAAESEGLTFRQRLTSAAAWSDVAHNFRGDWQMLYKEILTGFLLAGFAALLPESVWHVLFLKGGGPLAAIENVLIGPIIAVLSFVCSVGNIPLAAVLWSGGISFAGVIAFIFADLIIVPILIVYRKYYGSRFAWRITALMFVTMVGAALVVDGIFSAFDLIPSQRPSTNDVFGMISIDYKLVLNILGVMIFAGLMYLTVRRGAVDPACGMTVDRAKAVTSEIDGKTYFFCSDDCRAMFQSQQDHATASEVPAGKPH